MYVYQLFSSRPEKHIGNLLNVYIPTLLFSTLLSLPAFIIYFLVFGLLKKREIDIAIIKLISIALAVCSIIITMQLALPKAPVWDAFKTMYIVSAVIGGLLFEIKDHQQ